MLDNVTAVALEVGIRIRVLLMSDINTSIHTPLNVGPWIFYTINIVTE